MVSNKIPELTAIEASERRGFNKGMKIIQCDKIKTAFDYFGEPEKITENQFLTDEDINYIKKSYEESSRNDPDDAGSAIYEANKSNYLNQVKYYKEKKELYQLKLGSLENFLRNKLYSEDRNFAVQNDLYCIAKEIILPAIKNVETKNLNASEIELVTEIMEGVENCIKNPDACQRERFHSLLNRMEIEKTNFFNKRLIGGLLIFTGVLLLVTMIAISLIAPPLAGVGILMAIGGFITLGMGTFIRKTNKEEEKIQTPYTKLAPACRMFYRGEWRPESKSNEIDQAIALTGNEFVENFRRTVSA